VLYIEEEYFSEEEITSYSEEGIIEEDLFSNGETIDEEDVEEDTYFEDIIESDGVDVLYKEEEYFSEEEIIDEDFEEYIVEEKSNFFEASLDRIIEEDDHSNYSERSDVFDEVLDEDFLDSGDFVDEVILDDDDESYIEEEIIPQFEVPFVPAIVAWQEQEEQRASIEDEKPPEVAPRTPRNVLMAVLAAAASDFKLRKVPEGHKKRFEPMADAAACLGRLTKLPESTIESTGRASQVKTDDWSPTGAPIIFERSLNVRLVNEAAAMGRVMRLKEKVITNYEEETPRLFDENRNIEIDELLDEKGRPVFRTSVLVPLHELDTRQESMSRDWNMGFLEASDEADTLSIHNVKLPTTQVPRFNRPLACSPVMSRQEINDAIARGVAEGAWSRKYRLDRPQRKLRITSMCRCQYCQNPNAYQTHAYKELSKHVH